MSLFFEIVNTVESKSRKGLNCATEENQPYKGQYFSHFSLMVVPKIFPAAEAKATNMNKTCRSDSNPFKLLDRKYCVQYQEHLILIVQQSLHLQVQAMPTFYV